MGSAVNSTTLARWDVGVVIPARNEQQRIQRCLVSVLDALDHCAARRTWVVLSADQCSDKTARRAREILLDRGDVLECDAGSAGAARRLGAQRLLERLGDGSRAALWIANTDADGFVPRCWINEQLRLADEGVTAVAGVVDVDSFESHGPDGATVFARHYLVNPDGTHDHVHGANLGVRADAYVDAGGWSDVAAGEDHCLWRRLKAGGWPVRSAATCRVTTSGRLRGRAHGGFADTLARRLRLALPSGRPMDGEA